MFIGMARALLLYFRSSGSVLDHRSLLSVFESRRRHIWRWFHLWLRFISFGGHSAHLAYHVPKSGRNTSIIIITIIIILLNCNVQFRTAIYYIWSSWPALSFVIVLLLSMKMVLWEFWRCFWLMIKTKPELTTRFKW